MSSPSWARCCPSLPLHQGNIVLCTKASSAGKPCPLLAPGIQTRLDAPLWQKVSPEGHQKSLKVFRHRNTRFCSECLWSPCGKAIVVWLSPNNAELQYIVQESVSVDWILGDFGASTGRGGALAEHLRLAHHSNEHLKKLPPVLPSF